MSMYFYLFLSLLLAPSMGAFVNTNYYLDDESGQCAGAPSFKAIMQCDACINTGQGYAKYSCTGNGVSMYYCSDSQCGSCSASQPIPGCMAGMISYSVIQSFPSVPSNNVVYTGYLGSTCSGNPFAWVIMDLEAFSGITVTPQLCEQAYNGQCQSGANVPASDSLGFQSAAMNCGSSFTPPSSGSASSGSTSSGSASSTTGVTAAPTLPPNCTITPGQCSFYQNCAERAVPCGTTDYALAYGYSYCNAYMRNIGALSSAGQTWLENSLECLQEELAAFVQVSPRPSCNAVRAEGFASIARCYLNSTVCFGADDWSLAMSVVGKALFISGSNQVVTSNACFSAYKLSNIYKISNITAASETLASLIQKLASILGLPSTSISILDSSSTSFQALGSSTKREAIVDSSSTANADITFVFYADSDEAVVEYEAGVTEKLNNQTVWPSVKVTTCASNSISACRSSTDVVGPATTTSSGTVTGIPTSSASSLFSLFTVMVVVAGLFATL